MISKIYLINGINTYYRVGGDKSKPPLVWFDGLSVGKDLKSRLEKSEKILSSFFEDFCVYAFEYPSFMRSDVPETELNAREYSEIIDLFIDKLKLEKPLLLMGHSTGAKLALAYAGYYPKNIKLLVISAPPATYKLSSFYLTTFNKVKTLIQYILASPHLSDDYKKLLPKYILSTSDENLEINSINKISISLLTFLHFVQTDILNLAKKVTAPTMLLVGKFDILVPFKNTKKLFEILVNGKQYVYYCGHTNLPWKIVGLKDEILKRYQE